MWSAGVNLGHVVACKKEPRREAFLDLFQALGAVNYASFLYDGPLGAGAQEA